MKRKQNCSDGLIVEVFGGVRVNRMCPAVLFLKCTTHVASGRQSQGHHNYIRDGPVESTELNIFCSKFGRLTESSTVGCIQKNYLACN